MSDTLEITPVDVGNRAGWRHLRAVLIIGALLSAASALYSFQAAGDPGRGWWLLALTLLLGALGQFGVEYPALPPAPPALPVTWRRRAAGMLIALGGALMWANGVRRLLANWELGFDTAWISWAAGTILMGVGADLAWGKWPRRRPSLWSGWPMAGLLILLVAAAVYRLGNIAEFPGEGMITQIEDLQVGGIGDYFLHGDRPRWRWEYLSSTWLAALGLTFGGPTQLSVRIPFAIVSVLKLVPVFAWLRLSVGSAGALVGCALLAVSFWDIVLSRIPNNHNALVVAVAFALLAGPVRRGRPSGYIWLGFLGGYILHEYVAYRPLVLWAMVGAVWWSLTDRHTRWPARMARPLVTAALVVSMVTPLFVTRLQGDMRHEYFDGWNRARAIREYYNPEYSWQRTLDVRLARTRRSFELFVYRGDPSSVRNIKGLPMVDVVTAGLLLLGVAAVLAHPLRPVLALTLAGFITHVLGALVLTGNFDVGRLGGAVPYVYVLAGIGAAGVVASLAALGRAGRALALAALLVAVGWTAWWNTRTLREFWSSPGVRRAHHHPPSYFTGWVRDHRQPDERVFGVSPLYAYALNGYDGIWLLGGRVPGKFSTELDAALRAWAVQPGPAMFLIFSGNVTPDLARYVQWLAPELEFTFVPGPYESGSDIGYARAPTTPAGLSDRLNAARCRGAVAELQLIGKTPDEVLANRRMVLPLITRAVWPEDLIARLEYIGVQRIRVLVNAPFQITNGGEYRFGLDVYDGRAELRIDGHRQAQQASAAVYLGPGWHELVLEADLAGDPNVQLRWSGPDTGNKQELIPFYRIAAPVPDCPPGPPAGAAGAQ
ncbi:MAG: glycosyltransferase family 39 protein [Candidatus Binatia bacterium]